MDISFDGLISSDTANTAKGGIKFQPKGKPKPKPKPKPNAQPEPKPAPPPSTQPVEVAASTAEQTRDDVNQIIGNIVDSLQSSFEKSPEENAEAGITLDSPNDFLPESTTATVTPALDVSVDGKLAAGPTEPELITNIDDSTTLKSIEALDPLTGEKGAIYNDNDGFQIGNLSSGSKEVEDAIFWEPNILDQSGPRVSKFKPKPKAQTRKLEQIANNPDQGVGPVQHGENISSIPSQTAFVENEPAPFTPETISDYHVNEESISLTELSQMDSVNQTGRSSKRSRRLKSKALQIIDEVEIEGNDANNDDYVPEIETIDDDDNESKSKSKSKAKKPLDENKKPVRKRKKDKEVSGDLTEVPKKKFSHSTKRNKRPVNPELLTIPEDEFELHMHNFPLRDLIRLREHKERIEKKEASLAGTNANDESESAQRTDYYNYRTHMKITPRMKWTKQDTELFYEAVQQFGSDFSIIAECFPGRTREQIKSKFKKESKQHRLRMDSALNSRVKGLSRFEYVLERLKQARGEDSENDNDDPTGEEDGVQEADDNNEGGLQKEVKDMKADESPIKADDDIEDDDDAWNQYTGDI
ncbi:putative transcription factor MYB-HB-like family [Helianthus annuus]|uniref:Transcription factor MYB/SANT family n=2 Tax=Helianthus annuus TaxID=4232 RepID=A0A9K3HZ79_HELAN|nr:transcription factor TFIIIB component B'' [Helianthus annuus]XP_021988022.1 transcription factor TFIIIB component B'' [Helianthus annuus]XP_035834803.1 transcription factor TFIIIB component B'' [Helianthus annuus]XP_035834804.1 transcription factor TFIIIB component B'' [Helianthus annuus]KAF5787005.1 putative transcription factor MYB/SANT family [Helianthus annuus]KAJ0530465.1 putative transcription factor MYB/SANT family [Helianthus annuus]KAJ0880202.1 putative transcription factor MYB-HB